MCSPSLHRRGRRHPAGVEQRPDFARHRQRVDAAIDILVIAVVGGIATSDRAVHRRPDLRRPAHLRARLPGRGRPRRQPLPAADRARLPRHRVLLAGRRHRAVAALAQSRRGLAQRGTEEAAAMDSVAQRLSAVGAGNALELRGVTRLFGALAALTDITLTVRPGERRAVLGSNGAGKTTLFNCITGDFLPTSGTIRFFGEDVTAFPPYERIRRGLRRTYQISALFPGLSVLDNVYLACRGVSRGRFSMIRPSAQTTRWCMRPKTWSRPCISARSRTSWSSELELRPAAAARDRAGARRRAALHPVRRARRGPVADRARRTGRDPVVAARRISATSSSSTTWMSRCASSKA